MQHVVVKYLSTVISVYWVQYIYHLMQLAFHGLKYQWSQLLVFKCEEKKKLRVRWTIENYSNKSTDRYYVY